MDNFNDLAGPLIIAGAAIGIAVAGALATAAFKLGGVISSVDDVKKSIDHIHSDLHELGKELRGRFDRLEGRLNDHVDRESK